MAVRVESGLGYPLVLLSGMWPFVDVSGVGCRGIGPLQFPGPWPLSGTASADKSVQFVKGGGMRRRLKFKDRDCMGKSSDWPQRTHDSLAHLLRANSDCLALHVGLA